MANQRPACLPRPSGCKTCIKNRHTSTLGRYPDQHDPHQPNQKTGYKFDDPDKTSIRRHRHWRGYFGILSPRHWNSLHSVGSCDGPCFVGTPGLAHHDYGSLEIHILPRLHQIPNPTVQQRSLTENDTPPKSHHHVHRHNDTRRQIPYAESKPQWQNRPKVKSRAQL